MQTFHFTWNSALQIWRAAPVFILIGLSAFVIGEFVKLGIPTEGIDNKLVRGGIDVLANFLLLPLEFAIYRLLLLGEQPSTYWPDFSSVRFRRFLMWFAVLWIALIGPDLFFDANSEDIGALALSIGLYIVVLIVSLRMILLFPAIAVAADSVTIRDIFLDARGRTWAIWKAHLGAFALLIVAYVLPMIMIDQLTVSGETSDTWAVPALLRAILDGAMMFGGTLIGVMVAAQLFQFIGDRVKQDRAISPSLA